MKVIIRCAGSGKRWGDYRGVPKHLVKLCGEPVLHRAVRLIGETCDAEVKVVVPDLRDRRYLVPGSSRTVDKPNPANGDLDKIASSRHLWDPKDRTVVLWGDTWWTRAALTSVLTAQGTGWEAWLRQGPNGAGGELFAFSWPATANAGVSAALDHALAEHHAGHLATAGYNGRPMRGGWALLRSLEQQPGETHPVTDWTEDMDTPRDWHEWCHRYGMARPSVRKAMTR